MKLEFLDRFSKKKSKYQIYQTPFSGSRVLSCGRTDGWTEDRRTDITKIIVDFCNFENVPKTLKRNASARRMGIELTIQMVDV
jgi:hypothetical protein